MGYGHGPIYDWEDLSVEDLEKAVKLIGELEDLGIQCCSEEMLHSMQEELKQRLLPKIREAVGEWHKGQEVTDVVVEELHRRYQKSGDSFKIWLSVELNSCFNCDQDCSKCNASLPMPFLG